MNEFEKYPVLTEYIREYASFGHFSNWSGFLATLNELLVKVTPPLPADLEAEAEKLYPDGKDWQLVTGTEQQLSKMLRSAYLAAAVHFQERVKELEGELSGYKEANEDKQRLVRELDVIINGKDAAKQASLCDIVSQLAPELSQLRDERDRLKIALEEIAELVLKYHKENGDNPAANHCRNIALEAIVN